MSQTNKENEERWGEVERGKRRGKEGQKSVTMWWGIHLCPEQVFSSPLIRSLHGSLTSWKDGLSPISVAQAVAGTMVD